ncbi:unnamed protein product [Clonostachys rosea f. rosea IK726]|uniref:Uncharacterized protein n=1 Tax=Clonostachys rosea f. rosea IK726 TaxID=1349383 RepID=A0ACA9TKR4_BIOOC|nr:unnamed protein product [Clonostachys rosea f. rosea IK726]
MSGAHTPISASAPRALACSLCQKRKVKCDHNKPCGNCVKADVPCIPAPPPMPRRKRQPNAELRTRLARCEILLEKFASVQDLAATPSTSAAQSTVGEDSPPPSRSPGIETLPDFDDFRDSLTAPSSERDWSSTPRSRLVNDHGSTRFTDSLVWGMIKAMQSIIGSEGPIVQEGEGTDLHEDSGSCHNCARIMHREEENARPTAAQLIRLWQIFLDRVHPLTKIIHAPSFQPYVVDATGNFGGQPWNIQALLFAICQIAVISLDEEECMALMGCTRDDAVRRFSSAGRSILHRHSFLRNNDLTTLQAVVLQMLSAHGRSNPRASWILNGLCVRIAQGLGVHRDGETLGLPPFETEMRRRVWWQIVMLDLHSSFSTGLAPSLLPRWCDSKLPTNLNDSDMNPGATQYFTDRQGPTEMIVCLLTFRMGEFLIKTPGLGSTIFQHEAQVLGIDGPPASGIPSPLDAKLKAIDQALDETMAKYSLPSAGPIHALADKLRYSFSGKLRDMLLSTSQESAEGGSASPQDRLFEFVILDIGHAMDVCRSLHDKNFRWFLRMFFSQKGFFYLVGQVCQRTSGPLVDHAWQIIEDVYLFFEDFANMSQPWNFGLGTLVLKAWRAREAALRAALGGQQQPPVPACVEILRDKIGLATTTNGSTPSSSTQQTPGPAGSMGLPGGVVDYNNPTNYNAFGGVVPPWNDMIDEAQFDWGLWAATAPTNMETF